MRPVKLDARLSSLAQMIPRCATMADIGANHGLLSAYLLQQNRVDTAIITDITESSLRPARLRFEGDPLAARVEFRVGDGLEPLGLSPDCCVISGMGGETITGILRRGIELVKDSVLVLQPNVDMPLVRAEVCALGFAITDEMLVHDGQWWYPMLRAEPSDTAVKPDARQLEIGPVLMRRGGETLLEYGRRNVRILQTAIERFDAGQPRQQSGSAQPDAEAPSSQLVERLNIWLEYINANAAL